MLKRRSGFLLTILTFAILVAVSLSASPVQAQPFGAFGLFDSENLGYLEVPHAPALNPVDEITVEMWISMSDIPTGCVSLVGKNWQEAWWLGACNGLLRSYIKGSGTPFDRGRIPQNQWTHVAVTYDGSTRRHYINGELIGGRSESGPLTSSTSALRVGSDVSWSPRPDAAIDEVRLWNVARTTQEIQADLNERQDSPRPGLVAVWGLEGPADEVGPFDGAFVGDVFGLTLPVAPDCGTSGGGFLCLGDRFSVRMEWRAPDDSEGNGTVVPGFSNDSGLFWFFDPDNWEVLVKALDACVINDHFWIFSASTTNVFYRMEVNDVVAGRQKIYFNYPGPPAPAVTDTVAFPCP